MELKKGQHIAANIDSWSTKEGDVEEEIDTVNLGYEAKSV